MLSETGGWSNKEHGLMNLISLGNKTKEERGKTKR